MTRHILILFLMVEWLAASPPPNPPPTPPTLDQQSAARLLRARFNAKDLSFALFDVRSGDVIVAHWPDLHVPAPLGSLIKPFTAEAYGEEHGYNYPRYVCRGKADRCWNPRGHGELGIVEAVADSCNAYFQMLASTLRPQTVAAVMRRYGIDQVPENVTSGSMIGLGDSWQISPMQMAHAYLELVRRRSDAGVREVVRGMEMSASVGTGKAVNAALPQDAGKALTKTGTAPCVHAKAAPGDGYVIALYPADQPQYLLMVRVHGVPGSKAAEQAGRILSTLVAGKP